MIRPIASDIISFMKRKVGLSTAERLERHRVVKGECWETTLTPKKKYPQMKINGKNVMVHRAAYEALVGPIPDGKSVLHSCDNPRCHRPDHLYAGTLSQNMKDMWARGRHKLPTPRIDRGLVLSLADTLSQKEIARRVGASQTAISVILRAHGASRGKNTSFNKATKKKATSPK